MAMAWHGMPSRPCSTSAQVSRHCLSHAPCPTAPPPQAPSCCTPPALPPPPPPQLADLTAMYKARLAGSEGTKAFVQLVKQVLKGAAGRGVLALRYRRGQAMARLAMAAWRSCGVPHAPAAAACEQPNRPWPWAGRRSPCPDEVHLPPCSSLMAHAAASLPCAHAGCQDGAGQQVPGAQGVSKVEQRLHPPCAITQLTPWQATCKCNWQWRGRCGGSAMGQPCTLAMLPPAVQCCQPACWPAGGAPAAVPAPDCDPILGGTGQLLWPLPLAPCGRRRPPLLRAGAPTLADRRGKGWGSAGRPERQRARDGKMDT